MKYCINLQMKLSDNAKYVSDVNAIDLFDEIEILF